MLTIIISAFVASLLFNLFVILFGTKDVEALKARMKAGGSYLDELNDAITEEIGEDAARILKLVLVVALLIFLLCNLVNAIAAIVAVCLGTWAAKAAYKIGAVSNVLNKIATYINRLR